ncbi:MAG: putative secreted protein, partial [Afipia broomeae]
MVPLGLSPHDGTTTEILAVEPIDVRTMMNAAAAGSATMGAVDGAPRLERRKRLTPAALAVAN